LIYHVFNRAAAKFKMFRTAKDKQAFEKALVEALARFPGVRLLGWCVMENHWHLVLWPTADGELARFMHWLTLAHASRWRASHRTIGWGPLYQGRYKSFVVQDDAHYLTVLRYVERNALRAGLVSRAERWRWGSLFARVSLDGQPELTLATGPVPLPRDWVELVNAPQTRDEEEALKMSIHRGRPFGDERWQRRMADRLGLESCFRRPGRPLKPAVSVRSRA
jgi:putative transposase